MKKQTTLFSIPLIYLLAIVLFIAVPVMVRDNAPAEITRYDYPRMYPERCAEVLKKRLGGIKPIYSTICYVKDGMFITPILYDTTDTAYIARIEAAKDSLRQKFAEGW